ncbi:condensation domain-containing protein [Streptomyces tricolor]|nr:condensation domain-containing protein [Streptomyces tricolor]
MVPHHPTAHPASPLAALPGDEVLLLWSTHHIVLDGWSTGQLLAEVCERYARPTGGPDPAPPVRRPFADFLHWLRAQDGAAAERHWADALARFAARTRAALRPHTRRGPPRPVRRGRPP